jgi:hypothetical protein
MPQQTAKGGMKVALGLGNSGKYAPMGHRPPVRRWLTPSHARGVEGVQIHWAPGPPWRMPQTWVPTIQEGVQAGPAGCGLERAHWTYAELATSG